MTTVTQWFDQSEKPARQGVYETRYSSGFGFEYGYSYWDSREGWTNQALRLSEFKEKWRYAYFGGAIQSKDWRGLAEKPRKP